MSLLQFNDAHLIYKLTKVEMPDGSYKSLITSLSEYVCCDWSLYSTVQPLQLKAVFVAKMFRDLSPSDTVTSKIVY